MDAEFTVYGYPDQSPARNLAVQFVNIGKYYISAQELLYRDAEFSGAC